MASEGKVFVALCISSLSILGAAACDAASGGVNDGQAGSTLNNGVDDDHDGKVDEAGEIATAAPADGSGDETAPSDGTELPLPIGDVDASVTGGDGEAEDDDDEDATSPLDASVAPSAEPDAGLPSDDDEDEEDDDFPFPGFP